VTPPPNKPAATTELLLLPDGQVLAHNITPTMAALLAELNPADEPMRLRATASEASGSSAELRNCPDEAIGCPSAE
jgi:hypothetical protein